MNRNRYICRHVHARVCAYIYIYLLTHTYECIYQCAHMYRYYCIRVCVNISLQEYCNVIFVGVMIIIMLLTKLMTIEKKN